MLFIISMLLSNIIINFTPLLTHPSEITNTTCTYVAVTLLDKRLKNPYHMTYQYNIIINENIKNKSLILYHNGLKEQYDGSLALINHTIPCFIWHPNRSEEKISLYYPPVFSTKDRYTMGLSSMFIGVMVELMWYNNLSF